MTDISKTDFQIAWELSQTTEKPFFIDTFRKLLGQYDNEDISLSKFVEELNIAAYKWKNQPIPVNQDGLEFAKWLEENTRVVYEEKITMYRYHDNTDGWGNFTLEDIYTVFNDKYEPIPVQEGLREDDLLNILVWYQSKGDQYRNETELVNCVKDFLQVHPEKKEK